VPESVPVLRSLDDGQVQDLLERLATRRRAQAEETAGKSAEDLRQDQARRMEKALDRWTGTVTREQRARIARWAEQRAYAGATWQQYQAAWAEAFAAALARRTEPGFELRLAELLAEDGRIPYAADMAKVRSHNRQAWVEAMADLSATLTPAQRRHLRDRLRELADDLEELAGQVRAARAPLHGLDFVASRHA
jgi:hypothetical protein